MVVLDGVLYSVLGRGEEPFGFGTHVGSPAYGVEFWCLWFVRPALVYRGVVRFGEYRSYTLLAVEDQEEFGACWVCPD